MISLNADQQAFINHLDGAVLLHAPVGTGKTRALAARAANAIQQGFDPNRILCLTFTNRAAQEMREAIETHCGSAAERVHVRTFHGLCSWMLRCEASRIGLSTTFTVIDEVDAQEALKTIMQRNARMPCRPQELFFAIQGSLSKTPASLLSSIPIAQLTQGLFPVECLAELDSESHAIASEYEVQLASEHQVDFPNLVLFTRAMLANDSRIHEHWNRRFDLVQVDEMQDTHLTEYEVVRQLGTRTGNLALVGDYDQTIYEWRGSAPDEIIAQFRQDFPNGRDYAFKTNYRTTQTLLDTAAHIAATYSEAPPPHHHEAAEAGAPVSVHFAEDSRQEAEWIAEYIEQTARSEGIPLHRIAVLCRTNRRSKHISQVLRTQRIPCLTVEDYEFFRRQEIKDALAYLRLLLNPNAHDSLERILKRLPLGIGRKSIERVRSAHPAGLRLGDLARRTTLEMGEVFAQLRDALNSGTVTVFDLETTGTDLGRDEIIEVFALKLERGTPVDQFHRCLKLHQLTTVGDSERIHGISDEQLMAEGVAPKEGLQAFASFAGDSLLVGHNVGFDVRMINSYARRLGIELYWDDYADTFELAKRFVAAERFRLEDLAGYFGLRTQPTHRAAEDVQTTCELLERLIDFIEAGRLERERVIAEAADAFGPIADQLESLRSQIKGERPPDLLTSTLRQSGLLDHYSGNEQRMNNLRELWKVFKRWDDPDIDSLAALESILQRASLTRNLDLADEKLDRVRILTIHQSKGLEFDAVVIGGMTDGELPHFMADGADEEQRVFYVGITRARRVLCLSGHAWDNGSNRAKAPSPFFRLIGPHWIEEGSDHITNWLRQTSGGSGR